MCELVESDRLTVSVNYASADGTATVTNSDYTATSGTLTFLPLPTARPLTVLVNGDTSAESDRVVHGQPDHPDQRDHQR